MNLTLHYGKTGLPLTLPDDWDITVIRKPDMPVLPDPRAALEKALARPVGAKPLSDEARGLKTACILICDFTRPAPNGLILPVLVKELLAAGLKPENIIILVATGFHRPNLGEELRRLVNDDWVLKTVETINHYARRDHEHADLGRTARGTPIKIDRRFVEADLRLVIGLVEPHFMAGYSGGRKIIVPGVAHQETITRLHSAEFLEHPLATNLILEGNPLHLEQLDMISRLEPVLAVNTVIDPDRRVSFLNFGEIKASHLEAVAFMRPYAEIPVPARFDTIITTSAGHPLDATYYQTIKGLVAAMGALKPGGRLFIASACSEGLGDPDFALSQADLVQSGVEGFLEKFRRKTHAAPNEWQTFMQTKPMRVGEVRLFTQGLTAAELALTGLPAALSLEKAVTDWVRQSGGRRVAVIPEGPYVVPFFQERPSDFPLS